MNENNRDEVSQYLQWIKVSTGDLWVRKLEKYIRVCFEKIHCKIICPCTSEECCQKVK